MKCKTYQFIKLIHVGGFEVFNSPPPFLTAVEIGADVLIPQKEKLPIRLQFRYSVEKDDRVIFSCIGEGHYALMFDFKENPFYDIIEWLDQSYLNFRSEWNKISHANNIHIEMDKKLDYQIKVNKVNELIHCVRQLQMIE